MKLIILSALGAILSLHPPIVSSQTRAGTGWASRAACELGQATADLDANNVRARLYNSGNLFWRGRPNVYTVPIDGEANAVFASGIWIGGFVEGDLRLAGGTYGPFEYWPGPLDDQGQPSADCAAFDRIFKVSRDDVATYEQTGTATADLAEWPWQLGAPVADGDGVADNYDLAGGDRPELLGDQTVWWVMNDAGGVKEWSQTEAVGLEVQVTAYASAGNAALDNTTLYRYKLIHKGSAAFEAAYFGLWSDPDIGDASDDFIGSDTLRDMGFAYNGRDFDAGFDGYGAEPPALGYVILQGPTAENDGKDNDRDGETDEDGERLGMSNFLLHTNNSCCNSSSPADYYNYLQGRWRDGSPITVGGNGFSGEEPTHFMFSGDPSKLAYWSEENTDGQGSRNTPADRRFLMSTGPFTLEPGQEEVVDFAIVWSRGLDRLLSVAQLKRDADRIRAFFQGEDYEPPVPPSTPGLVSPPDESTNVTTTPTFTWRPSGESLYYLLQVSRSVSFQTLAGEQLVLGKPSASLPLQNDMLYFWRVRAENLGGASAWSPTRSFTTGVSRQTPASYSFFETVANGAGPINPPVGAAADFQGFPVPSRPGPSQQVGEGVWMIHTGDNDSRGSFDAFVARTSAGSAARKIVPYDFEIRFTAEGSIGYDPFCTGATMPVPFELWRIGIRTPDDPSDDIRMVPYVLDNDFNGIFSLNSDAGIAAGGGACAGQADHTASGGANDPSTDWFYWATPDDETPGVAGYRAWEAAAIALGGGDDGSFYNELATDNSIRRMVLFNWNGGDVTTAQSPADYNQEMPEEGTIFRIITIKPIALTFETRLTGLNVVQPVETRAGGGVTLSGTPQAMTLEGPFSNLSGDFIAATLFEGHADTERYPTSEGTTLTADLSEDRRSGTFLAEANTFVEDDLPGSPPSSNQDRERNWFVVIQTTAFPDGELRGQLLPTPNSAPQGPLLTAPDDQAVLALEGDGAILFEAAWQAAGDANANRLVYLWQLAAELSFTQPLVTRNVGTETRYRTTYSDLDRLLDAAGVAVAYDAPLYHRVLASDGSLVTAGPFRSIQLTRGTVIATDEAETLPQHFTLQGNFPNPFNPTTTLVFDLPQPAEVSVAVYDLLGRHVLWWQEGLMAAGSSRQLRLDAASLASGVYFYRITARAATTRWQETGRMVLVR